MSYQKAQLAYCSNVHPGASLAEVESNLSQHFAEVRKLRQLSAMASGLWLSAETASELVCSQAALESFKNNLANNGVLLTSLNGFPFGNFHLDVVKEKVYLPTWAETSRLTYTQQLADILAACLPDNINIGAISTLPFAYASNWSKERHHSAIAQLLALTKYLKTLEQQTKKRIVLCLEMEPDCVFQATDELVTFFTNDLLPAALKQGISNADVLRYIGCCYDTCHQAVMNENIGKSLTKINQAGIYIGKIQISNAVQATLTDQQSVTELTTLFQDAKFLHQSKIFHGDKYHTELADLNQTELAAIVAKQPELTANIHYHIPIHQTVFEQAFLSSTQTAIMATLDFVKNQLNYQPYLEIETYTWLNLIAKNSKQSFNLHHGLAAEFTWLEQALTERNLLK
ncbi:MAG: metabolite traffic protein EboE [Thalassotalea sp.]